MANDTFGSILQACLDFLPGPTDDLTERILKRQINMAHSKYVNMCRWAWRKRGCTLAVTSSTTTVALPDGITVLDAVGATPTYCALLYQVSVGSTGRVIDYRPRDLVERAGGTLDSRGRGTPNWWDAERRLLIPMPYPVGDDTLGLRYLAGHSDMSDDADVPVIPAEHTDVLIWEPLKFMTLAGGNPDLYPLVKDEARRAEENLKYNGDIIAPEYFAQLKITGLTNRG